VSASIGKTPEVSGRRFRSRSPAKEGTAERSDARGGRNTAGLREVVPEPEGFADGGAARVGVRGVALGGVVALALGAACSGAVVEDEGSTDAAAEDSSSEVASGGTSGAGGAVEAGDAGSGGSGGAGIDASADSAVTCVGLGEAECVALMKQYKCAAYFGWKVPTGPSQFVACGSFCVGSAAMSCSVDPTGTCWRFPDTCSPDGWTYVEFCNSEASAACAGAIPKDN